MRLPTFADGDGFTHTSPTPIESFDALLAFDKGHHRFSGDGWSSLIGIITAIVGNILISVALNTQRYAHIRLNKEWAEEQKRRRKEEQANGNGAGNPSGHAQSGDKLQRRPMGAESLQHQQSDYSLDSATETDALLPRTAGGNEDLTASNSTGRSSVNGQKSYLKSPYWWIGLILMTTGEAGNFLAYGFAPASIVSPLGVVALISNCIIAPFMLKERFRVRDAIGVLIAIAGAVTVVISAKSSNPKLGPDEIWSLIATWEFETYLGITAFVIVVLIVASEKIGDKSIFIDLGLVGLFGGYTALATKGVASLLSFTLFRALTFPVTYLFAFVLVLTAIMQIRYLNRALQRFNSTEVIPTQFVLFTLSVILGSAVLYRDFERTTAENAGEFVGGCALTFAGVWLITSGRKQDPEDDETDFSDDDDVDAIRLVDEEYQDVPADDVEPRSERTSIQVSEPFALSSASSRRQSRQLPSSRRSSHLSSFIPPLEIPINLPSPAVEATPASIMENPWQTSHEASPVLAALTPQPSRPEPPPFFISTSEPVLPTTGPPSQGRPQTPRTPVASAATHTHMRGQPTTPRANPAHPFRQSLTEFVPGPLVTPLSGSLSAVVADTLMRGIDPSSIKRRRSIARSRVPNMPTPVGSRARATSEADLEAAAAATLPPTVEQSSRASLRDAEPDQTLEDASPSDRKRRGRGNTVTNTIGRLFRGKKGTKSDEAGTRGGSRAAD